MKICYEIEVFKAQIECKAYALYKHGHTFGYYYFIHNVRNQEILVSATVGFRLLCCALGSSYFMEDAKYFQMAQNDLKFHFYEALE